MKKLVSVPSEFSQVLYLSRARGVRAPADRSALRINCRIVPLFALLFTFRPCFFSWTAAILSVVSGFFLGWGGINLYLHFLLARRSVECRKRFQHRCSEQVARRIYRCAGLPFIVVTITTPARRPIRMRARHLFPGNIAGTFIRPVGREWRRLPMNSNCADVSQNHHARVAKKIEPPRVKWNPSPL